MDNVGGPPHRGTDFIGSFPLSGKPWKVFEKDGEIYYFNEDHPPMIIGIDKDYNKALIALKLKDQPPIFNPPDDLKLEDIKMECGGFEIMSFEPGEPRGNPDCFDDKGEEC